MYNRAFLRALLVMSTDEIDILHLERKNARGQRL